MRLRPLLVLALFSRLAVAQAPDTTLRVQRATISGVVHDSIARAPLAGAMVQLAGTDRQAPFGRTAVSDSLGRFALADVPTGRYALGFYHPMLDSLGMEPPLREVSVDGQQPVRADLAIPSPSRFRAAVCGPRPAPDSGGVVVGVVRDARDLSPAAGVSVTGEWLELSIRVGGVVRRVPRLVATTGRTGWFAMCGVPSAGTMLLMASRGADSTDRIELQVPAEGFVRRELYLGPARTVGGGDTAGRADSLAPSVRRLRLGDGRLSGMVVTAVGGQPLGGAQVGITDGPQTRANERGEWTLLDAPVGTRMLEIRAVGYYPERRRVDVVAGAAPVRVALSTLKAVLDTVKVTAALFDRNRDGFQQRSRTGLGRFLTPEDIARRQLMVVSDLFGMMPGVHLQSDGLDKRILMRGAFGPCEPGIYINGQLMTNRRADDSSAVTLTADDIDTWVRPNNVAGIEIYSESSAPGQFQQGLSGCGSIVIWTKR